MGSKVKSARGELVDFDLLKIKQQISESTTIDVAARENFVEKRLRRRTKRTVPAAPVKPIAVEPTNADLEEADSNVEEAEKEQPELIKPTKKVKQ